jgi:hypothetical protein
MLLCALLFAVGCSLPDGDDASPDLTDAEISALRLQCFYANPVMDRAVILSWVAKTAAARQLWIRSSHPSITEVLEQYPRLENMAFELVCINHFFNIFIFTEK